MKKSKVLARHLSFAIASIAGVLISGAPSEATELLVDTTGSSGPEVMGCRVFPADQEGAWFAQEFRVFAFLGNGISTTPEHPASTTGGVVIFGSKSGNRPTEYRVSTANFSLVHDGRVAIGRLSDGVVRSTSGSPTLLRFGKSVGARSQQTDLEFTSSGPDPKTYIVKFLCEDTDNPYFR